MPAKIIKNDKVEVSLNSFMYILVKKCNYGPNYGRYYKISETSKNDAVNPVHLESESRELRRLDSVNPNEPYIKQRSDSRHANEAELLPTSAFLVRIKKFENVPRSIWYRSVHGAGNKWPSNIYHP